MHLVTNRKLQKMIKKIGFFGKKNNRNGKNSVKISEEDDLEERQKSNVSNARSKMFKGRLPVQKDFKTKDQSKMDSTTSASNASSHDEKVENARALINAEDIKRIYMSEGWDGITAVRIKLIVTAINLHNPPNSMKDKLVKLTGIAKLGVVHTVIQIGPIILEWNDSSIVIPCETLEWASSKVLFALDMKTLTLDDFFMNYIDPVSSVVATWNSTYMYNEYTNNCQLFTEEIFKAMKIENVFTGKIKKFMDSMATADSKDLCFKHKFENDPVEYEITTHEALDKLCHKKSDFLWKNPRSEDVRLLKAYDRVFWLRYYGVNASERLDSKLKEELSAKFKPAVEEKCFFDDPTDTNTHYPKLNNVLEENNLHYK